MATIIDNILAQSKTDANIVKADANDVRMVVDEYYGGVSADDRIEDYVEKIAVHETDTPSKQVISTAARTTADGVEIKDTIGRISKMYGQTLVWNQLAKPYSTPINKTQNGISVVQSGNTFRVFGTEASGASNFINGVFKLQIQVAGNKYLLVGAKGGERDKYDTRFWGNVQVFDKYLFYTCSQALTSGQGQFMVRAGVTLDVTFTPMCFDLTRMFGSGQEPTTIDDFCLKIFGKSSADVTDAEWEAISAYCEPTLLSSKPKKIVSKPADNSWTSEISVEPTTILDEQGNKVFPNGLLSAGTIKDEIDFERGVAIKRIGSFRIDEVNWNYDAKNIRFLSTKIDLKYCKNNVVANIISSKYIAVTAEHHDSSTEIDKTMRGSIFVNTVQHAYFYLRDLSCTSVEELKSANVGERIYYELSNPIEISLSRKHFYRVSNQGTERITADGMTAPLIADIAYKESVMASESVSLLAEAVGL